MIGNVSCSRVRFQLGAGFKSRLAGHHNVQQDQIGNVRAGAFPGPHAVRRRDGAETLGVQHAFEHHYIDGSVVDDENGRGGC